LGRDRSVTCPTSIAGLSRRCKLKLAPPGYGSAKGNKKAGEYSEEDTHRPAHHYREVVARRTVGQVTGQSAIVTLEKETL
jgi:hypothetical protein